MDTEINEDFFIHTANTERKTTTRGSAGQVVEKWEPFLMDIPCYIRDLNGNELVAAEKLGYIAQERMYAIRPLDITRQDKVISNGVKYEITHINEQIAPHYQIDLKVVE